MSLTVAHLISGEIEPRFRDKLFWYADRVTMSGDVLDIYIDNNNGLTAFEEQAKELRVCSVCDLASLSDNSPWSTGQRRVLVSSGSFLWINGKLAVTQRTANTKFDPLSWTSPAGRCDDTPLRTALRETLEEIQISSLSDGTYWLPDIAKTILEHEGDYKFYSAITSFPGNISSKLSRIRCWLDEMLVDDSLLWHYFSEKANTLELRIPIQGVIPYGIALTNPEFRTDTRLVDILELGALNCVPSLRQLYREAI